MNTIYYIFKEMSIKVNFFNNLLEILNVYQQNSICFQDSVHVVIYVYIYI